MSREASFLRVLEAAVSIQQNTHLILEGKAAEAEKVSRWVINQPTNSEAILKESLAVHEQIVEQIDGLTRVSSGLCRNLRIALGTSDEEGVSPLGFGGFDLGEMG